MSLPDEFTAPADPWPLFDQWMALAVESEPSYPNAMTLATVGADGMPSARIMLLKGVDNGGFVFYTNRSSRKGGQLAAHARASLCFHWKSLGLQVRAEGMIAPVSESESDDYFATRPHGSQIGAWASLQSQPLESRAVLEDRVRELGKKYEGKSVPRPPHWGGYRLTPLRLEFWREREFRLHDRFVYSRNDVKDTWRVERQYP